jgi:hypothetical protein
VLLLDSDSVATLKASLESATSEAGWATLVVTAGVVIEFVALFAFSKEMPPVEKRVLAFATFLIAAGCGAEYWYGGAAATAAEGLQQVAQTEAAHANKEAGIAYKAAADSNAHALDTELKLALLQKKLGPRQVDRAIFLNEIKGFQAPQHVWIGYAKSATDGWAFSGQLISLLKEAGWPAPGAAQPLDADDPSLAQPPPMDLTPGNTNSGVVVLEPWGTPDHKSRDKTPFIGLLSAFAATCRASGAWDETRALPPGDLAIVIFPKP